jgi:hypothetical protein
MTIRDAAITKLQQIPEPLLQEINDFIDFIIFKYQPITTDSQTRANLSETWTASYVLSQNLIHGDALTMRTQDDQAITFAEWGYLGKGRFQRRDFRFDSLTLSSTFSAEDSLFAHLGKHEIFTPMKTYPPMTVSDLAAAKPIDTKAGGVSL